MLLPLRILGLPGVEPGGFTTGLEIGSPTVQSRIDGLVADQAQPPGGLQSFGGGCLGVGHGHALGAVDRHDDSPLSLEVVRERNGRFGQGDSYQDDHGQSESQQPAAGCRWYQLAFELQQLHDQYRGGEDGQAAEHQSCRRIQYVKQEAMAHEGDASCRYPPRTIRLVITTSPSNSPSNSSRTRYQNSVLGADSPMASRSSS